MSVPKSERNESKIQFLDTARKLEIECIRARAKTPHKYNFFIESSLLNPAIKILENSKKANTVYVTTLDEAMMRKQYITEALCNVQAIISQLGIIAELSSEGILSSGRLQTITSLCGEMDKLLRGLLKSDREKQRKYEIKQ